MKKILAILTCLCLVLLSGCGREMPAGQTEPAFSREDFLLQIQPHLQWLAQLDQETFGAEICWDQEYMAGYHQGALAALYPQGDPLPEGLEADPADARYYPIQNYTAVSQIRQDMEQYLAPEILDRIPFWQEDLLEFEGRLYLCRGGRGYGALTFRPDSLTYLGKTDGGHQVSLTYYLFEQPDHTAVLTFVPAEEGWILGDIQDDPVP